MKKEVKSQAALEFLTTYAWAFVVIMLTIGALYYFGIFDFAKFLPQQCTFPSQFQCIDFSFTADEVRFKLVNNIGERINVDPVVITNDASNPLSCTLTSPGPLPLDWDSGVEIDFVFSACSDGAFIVGERVEAKITMTYFAVDTPSQPLHTFTGKITAVVKP